MTTWHDLLQEGSFRGVAFRCRSHNHETGRRLARHEFPGRDKPYNEDLGRKQRGWSLELYVLGGDYMHQRDLLLSALEADGPGELVHPWLGRLTVRVDAVHVREDDEEGGVARFTVACVDDDGGARALYPETAPDTAAAVDVSADTAIAQAQTDFSSGFSVTSRPSYIPEAAAALITNDRPSTIQSLTGTLTSWQARIPRIPGQAYAAVSAIAALSNAATSLVRAPVNLAAEVVGRLQDVRDWVEQPVAALALYRDLSLFGAGLASIVGTTPGRLRQAANQAAFVALVRQAAVVEGVRLTSAVEWATSAEALAALEAWGDLLDGLLDTASDAQYTTLSGLRAALSADLTARGARLPDLVTFRPAATLPSLAVAYRLYDAADLEARAAELTARNRARHPGFLGSPLEVLSA